MWAYMQVEVLAADRLILPLVGPAVETRADAHAAVQTILDSRPILGEVAAIWRRGAKDDTVFSGPFTWTIFECDGDDPIPAARAWLADYAETMRGAGMDVRVALPATG